MEVEMSPSVMELHWPYHDHVSFCAVGLSLYILPFLLQSKSIWQDFIPCLLRDIALLCLPLMSLHITFMSINAMEFQQRVED